MMFYIEGGDVKVVLIEFVLGCVVVEDVLKFGIEEVLILCNILIDEKWCQIMEENLVDSMCVCLVVICDFDFGCCVQCYGCDLVCGYLVN